ncbi:hypothetical protein RI129_011312 [Pyrocoelia pectoralis]|uniref:Ig-like domain-containing protein n=1 Tax=Pyrocoelia pectoralis TaxID=417401 RepID=A0AAN7V8P4_9COLE
MLVIYLLVLNCVVGLEYVPSSRVIEVNESKDYTFGLIENDNSTNITRCTYQSNTGLSGSFDVLKSDKRHAKIGKIGDLGAAKLCQITVSDADAQLPTVWGLKAFSNGKALEEVRFRVKFYYNVPLATVKAVAPRNGDFYQHLNTNLTFISCKLNIGPTEIDLDLNSKLGSKVGDMEIVSLGDGVCGFKCLNASAANDSWSLRAVDGIKRSYRADFKYLIRAIPSGDEIYVRNIVQVGMSHIIRCGDQYSQEFCYLFNPLNEFVPTTSKDCYYAIKTVSMQDLGVWRCQIGRSPSMVLLQYRIELLIGRQENSVQSWVKESKKYVTIGCKLFTNIKSDYCRMVSPRDEIFKLEPGGAFNRYLSMGTNFSQGICAMRIEKPLQESDKGQWRCEFDITSGSTGAFIFLATQKRRKYLKHKKLTTQIGQPLSVDCQVSYSSDYCYIKSPIGTVHSMIDDSESRLGRCSLQLEKATVADVGNWSCFFARETGLADEEITIEVRLSELLSAPVQVDVPSGQNANLICSSYGLPLKYCRFISPSSQAYYIKNVQNSNRIRYYGKGLEYGECGITIQEAKPSDSGKWMCATRLGGDYKQMEITASVVLYVAPAFLEDPKVAIGLGTAAVVLVISGAIGYFGVKRWKRRRARLVASDSIENSSQSGEIFSFGSPTVCYSHLQGEREEHVHQR